jgi:hypothetical protein
MRLGATGFLSVPSVGMRLAPEVLVLELFRDTFFANSTSEQVQTRELQPDLRNQDNVLVFNPGERAIITSLRGRRKQTKRSKEDPFYAPAYPSLARESWLSKKRERVIARLLFEGAFAQHFWARGEETETGKQAQHDAVNVMIDAFVGTRTPDRSVDILAAALGLGLPGVDTDVARGQLMESTSYSSTVFQTDRDELADRLAVDFLSICSLEKEIPRLLWTRVLMTYLRFALPIWLLAQMRITCLVHRWIADALDGAEIPNESEIIHALAIRNHKLISPTLTPTREVFSRISEYIRCRVELNVALYCLEQLQPTALNGRVITTRKMGSGSIKLVDLLDLARRTSGALKADLAYGGVPNSRVFLSRASERFRAWRDPRNKGQGKNIDEFLRVLYRAEHGDEAGGHLLVREGRGDGAGFRVFPGQLLLQTLTFLAAKAKQTAHGNVPGGGKLVLRDIEEHFAQYGIDFSLAADARPLLIEELQGLGLLNGSPDAGSSVAVACPF